MTPANGDYLLNLIDSYAQQINERAQLEIAKNMAPHVTDIINAYALARTRCGNTRRQIGDAIDLLTGQ